MPSAIDCEALYLPFERRILRRLAELNEMYSDAGEIILTQEELAEVAGTSRATVNAVLRLEQEHGTIELRRGRITVRDGAELKRRVRARTDKTLCKGEGGCRPPSRITSSQV
jgi:hypothetical protein